jgi:hypothetical protein
MLDYLKDMPESGEHIAGSTTLSAYIAALLERPSVKAALA